MRPNNFSQHSFAHSLGFCGCHLMVSPKTASTPSFSQNVFTELSVLIKSCFMRKSPRKIPPSLFKRISLLVFRYSTSHVMTPTSASCEYRCVSTRRDAFRASRNSRARNCSDFIFIAEEEVDSISSVVSEAISFDSTRTRIRLLAGSQNLSRFRTHRM